MDKFPKVIKLSLAILFFSALLVVFALKIIEVPINIAENTNIKSKNEVVGVILNDEYYYNKNNKSHVEVLKELSQKHGFKLEIIQNIHNDDDCKIAVNDLKMSNAKIIIMTAQEHTFCSDEESDLNPKIQFFQFNGPIFKNNLTSFNGKMYQMFYVSGIVAGMQTNNNQIGFIATYPNNSTNTMINAFALGAKSVNSKAKIHVRFVNEEYNMDAIKKDFYKLLKNQKIDIVATNHDDDSVTRLARENNIWSIGYNSALLDKFPNNFLISPKWEWDTFYEEYLIKAFDENYKGKKYWKGFESNIVNLTQLNPKAKIGISSKVEAALRRLTNNTFNIFIGPLNDNNGQLKATKGEVISDYDLINNMNWYVNNVRVYL